MLYFDTGSQDLWQMKRELAFHFIISEGVGTMKGCRRLHPFSIITYHLSLFFSPFSLAPSSKRMGTLEGEASSELNIDKSGCVILVLICNATQGQPVCSLGLADCSTHAGLRFYSDPPTQIHFEKGARSDVCSFSRNTKAVLVTRSFYSIVCSDWPRLASCHRCRSGLSSVTRVDGTTEGILVGLFVEGGTPLNYHYGRVMIIRGII